MVPARRKPSACASSNKASSTPRSSTRSESPASALRPEARGPSDWHDPTLTRGAFDDAVPAHLEPAAQKAPGLARVDDIVDEPPPCDAVDVDRLLDRRGDLLLHFGRRLAILEQLRA